MSESTDEEHAHRFMGYNFGDDELGSAEHAELVRTLTLLCATVRAEAALAEREACDAAVAMVAWSIQPENDYGQGVKDGADGQLKACLAAIRARTATQGEKVAELKRVLIGEMDATNEELKSVVEAFAAPQPPASRPQEGGMREALTSEELDALEAWAVGWGSVPVPYEQLRSLVTTARAALAHDAGAKP